MQAQFNSLSYYWQQFIQELVTKINKYAEKQ